MIKNLFVMLLLFVLTLPCFAQDGLMAWWSFDEGEGRSVKDTVSGEMAESEDRPIVNPAFVFKGWGNRKAPVKVGGEKFQEGVNYRAGYEKKLDGVDLVLWLDHESEELEMIMIKPVN